MRVLGTFNKVTSAAFAIKHMELGLTLTFHFCPFSREYSGL